MNQEIKLQERKILIDFSAIKSGGGCQLAMNFVRQINELSINNNREDLNECFIFLIPRIGPLADLREYYPKFRYISYDSHRVIKRFYFEHFLLSKILKKWNVSFIYTFFGSGLLHSKNVKSIVCVAYPIICYNESDFWDYIRLSTKIKTKIKNYIRINRLKKADEILAETKIMRERLSEILKLPMSQINLLPPSVSEYVNSSERKYKLSKCPRFLLLSGISSHKNLWRLPEIAYELSSLLKRFKFIITSTEVMYLQSLKNERARSLFFDLKEHFEFVGAVAPDHINDLYENVDFLLSLSDLESFSNNYMEAWKANVPLIVSDRDFSRHTCGESALYIEPHNPNECAKMISDYLGREDLINRRLHVGKLLLEKLPSNEQKLSMIIDKFKN